MQLPPTVPRRIVSVEKSNGTMRRVLQPYLFSALNRCRRFKLAVVQTCSRTMGIGPLQRAWVLTAYASAASVF